MLRPLVAVRVVVLYQRAFGVVGGDSLPNQWQLVLPGTVTGVVLLLPGVVGVPRLPCQPLPDEGNTQAPPLVMPPLLR